MWQSSGGEVALHVMTVPGEIPLQPVPHVRRNGELMIFAGVNDKLRFATEGLQRLIHLFAAKNRYVPIDGATHEQRRRRDVFHAIKRRNLAPDILVLPRIAELRVVVLLVLVVTVEAGEFRSARP